MAISEEQFRLALELTGTDSIHAAVLELERMIQAAKASGNQIDALSLTMLQYKLAIDSESTALDAEVAALVESTAAHKAMSMMIEEAALSAKTAVPIIGGDNKGQSGLGRSALQASYAFQDFTSQLGSGPGGFARALGSIQNNIPGILMGFGVGGTVIAGVSLLSVMVGALVTNWDSLIKGMSSDAIKKAKDDLEALAKKVDDFNALLGKPTRAEAAGAKIIQEAIQEGDPARIARNAARALGASGKGETMTAQEKADLDTYQKQLEFAQANLGERGIASAQGSLDQARQAVRDRLAAANLKTVQAAIVDLGAGGEAGRKARGLLGPLVAADPRAFPPGLLGDIERADPADVKRQADLEAQGELNIENKKRADKEAKEAKEKQAHAKEALERLSSDAQDAVAKAAHVDRPETAVDVRFEDVFDKTVKDIRRENEKDAKKAADEQRRRAHAQQRAMVQALGKAQQNANQAIDNNREMAEYMVKFANGTLTQSERLAHDTYWAKQAVKQVFERHQESMRGSALDQ